jgi:hypothetical protein
MRHRIIGYGFPLLAALAVLWLAGPHIANAVVNELTLTGVPPNTVVTLTNETGQTEEKRTGDDGGSIVIPLTERNWEKGKYTVTITEKDGKTTAQQITLTDGVNKFEFGTLFTSLVKPKIPFRISDSLKMPIPETPAGETVTAVARGVVGGLLGGFMGGRGRGGSDGGERPSLPLRPSYPEQTLTAKDGKTKMNISGACDRDACQFTCGVKESPGNGAPHWILLQDNKGNVVQPSVVQVYEIWEVWGGWRMTVSWTKSYYQDGQLVRQERGGWSTGWITFVERYKSPAEIPSIWKDFGGKPFEGIRGVVADFKFPEGFNPADWNLVAHVTTKDGTSIVTQPFVAAMTKGERGVLSFTQREQTFWESSL